MEKVLSVSIAAYNVEKTLGLTLESFLKIKQLEKLDIIIVNDGSTDKTKEIAEKYTKIYPRSFRLINKENGGWGSTLNAAFAVARGKYFKQLDGDDYFSEENLDCFIDFLEKCETDLICSPFLKFDDATKGITGLLANIRDFPFEESINIDEIGVLTPPMHTLTVRTNILITNHIHIAEKCFYTDVEFVLKVLNYSHTVSFFELPIYFYRLGRDGQSMSISGVRKHYHDHQAMILRMLEYEKSNVHSKYVKDSFHARLSGAIQYMYAFYMGLEPTKKHKKELIDFDNLLKSRYSEYFSDDLGGNSRKFLRSHHYIGYGLISFLRTRNDKKNNLYIFEK